MGLLSTWRASWVVYYWRDLGGGRTSPLQCSPNMSLSEAVRYQDRRRDEGYQTQLK